MYDWGVVGRGRRLPPLVCFLAVNIRMAPFTLPEGQWGRVCLDYGADSGRDCGPVYVTDVTDTTRPPFSGVFCGHLGTFLFGCLSRHPPHFTIPP